VSIPASLEWTSIGKQLVRVGVEQAEDAAVEPAKRPSQPPRLSSARSSASRTVATSLLHSAPIDKLAVHTHTTAMHETEPPSAITSAEWAATPPTLQVFVEVQLGAIAHLPAQQAMLCELADTPAYTRVSRDHRSLWWNHDTGYERSTTVLCRR